MTYKNLLVQVDSSPRTQERVTLAVRLAQRLNARLTAVFAQFATAHRVGVVADWPPADYVAMRDEAHAAFAQLAGALPRTDWIDLNRGGEEEILHRMSDVARHFDLTVIGQDRAEKHYVPAELAEHLILTSGRPLLVIPYAGHFEDVGHRPLFAWNDTPASARALNDAVPLVCPNAEAVLAYITERDRKAERAEPLLSHLATHGIAAKFEQFVVGDLGFTSDLVLNCAADHGSDLIAYGGFGSYPGWSFVGRTNRTRFLLGRMTVPMLISH